MFKFFYIILLIILTCVADYVNAQLNLSWYRTSGVVNSTANSITGMDIDSSGNVYTIGNFQGNQYISNVDTFPGFGSKDFFVSKHDANGNEMWTKTGGRNGFDIAQNIKSDKSGNLYFLISIATSFFIFGTDTISGNSSGDNYLMKIDASGNLIWARSVLRRADGNLNHVSLSQDGSTNLFITGTYNADTLIYNSDTLYNSNSSGIVLNLMLDSSANVIWAHNAVGDSYGSIIFSDFTSNCYSIGNYTNTLIVGPDTLLGQGNGGPFIIKYDINGNNIWAKTFGNSDSPFIKQIKCDSSGDLILSGNFSSGPLILNRDTLNSLGYTDIFIAKIDSSGNPIWGKSIGSSESENLEGLDLDENGNIFIAGSFNGSSINVGTDQLTNFGGGNFFYDIILASLDSTGENLWALNMGGVSNEEADEIQFHNGQLITAGNLGSPPLNLGNITATSNHPGDNFVAKFDITTSVKDLVSFSIFTIYPNPTSGIVKLTNKVNSNKIIRSSVYDLYGKAIKIFIDSSLTEIDISDLSKGIYLIKVETEMESYTGKCVKM